MRTHLIANSFETVHQLLHCLFSFPELSKQPKWFASSEPKSHIPPLPMSIRITKQAHLISLYTYAI